MPFNPAYIHNRDDIADLIAQTPSSVLDVGCSNGALGRNLKRRYPGVSVVGLEGDAQMARAASEWLDRVLVIDLDGESWKDELRGQRFDLIVCADVLEHTRRPDQILAFLAGLLAERGLLIVSLPNIRHWSALAQIGLLGDWPDRDSGIFDRTHLRFFTRRSAIRMAQRAGLSVRRVVGKYPFYDLGAGPLHGIGALLARVPVLREFFSYQYLLVCGR